MTKSKFLNKDSGTSSYLPSLLSFLKARKKSTLQFLNENNITEFYMLGSFLSSLRQKYTVEDEFIDEAYLLLPNNIQEIIVEEPTEDNSSTYNQDVFPESVTEQRQQTTKSNKKSKKVV